MKKIAVIAFVGVGFFWFLVLSGGVQFRPDPQEVSKMADEIAKNTPKPSAPDPRVAAASRWLSERELGSVSWSNDAPDWANGTRLRIRSSAGGRYLFYFDRAGALCSVWTQEPREQVFDSGDCG